jgi:hypothetical protein
MLCSNFAFLSWRPPYAQEKCIARSKARCVPEGAELADLLWDSMPRERSLDHAASVALPDLR